MYMDMLYYPKKRILLKPEICFKGSFKQPVIYFLTGQQGMSFNGSRKKEWYQQRESSAFNPKKNTIQKA